MDDTDRKIRALMAFSPVTGHEIAYALTLKGYSQRHVARECGVSYQLVHDVIYSKNTSFNVASRIAAILSQPLNRLWPDGRYDRAGGAGERSAPRIVAAG